MESSSGKNYNKMRIVDTLGRVTIPADLRRKYKLVNGVSSVIVTEEDGKIVITPHVL